MAPLLMLFSAEVIDFVNSLKLGRKAKKNPGVNSYLHVLKLIAEPPLVYLKLLFKINFQILGSNKEVRQVSSFIIYQQISCPPDFS